MKRAVRKTRPGVRAVPLLAWAALFNLAAAASEPAAPDRAAEQVLSSAGFEIRWQALSGGGGMSGGGDFQIRGSVGLAGASAEHPASGPEFSHIGGFWAFVAGRGQAVVDRLFRDRFE